MALNIPNVESGGDSLLKGLDTGSTLMNRIMQVRLAQEKQKQDEFEFQQQQELKKQALAQQQPFDLLRQKIMQQQLSNLQKGPSLEGPARYAADLDKLKSQYGEDSQVYKDARAAYDSQIDAKNDLRDLRARTKAGLKPGEKEFFDDKTGAPLGKEIPLTAKERESEEGNILFNELYPYVYKGASPFSGEGSINRLQQAAANYKTNPKARQLFDDFLLSDKMLAATTVNEASTLKAGRTNRTYNMLKESLDAQDIPNVVKKLIKEYNIPASAQLRAGMRYQKILSEARQKARKGTPATQKLFYNPEVQAQHDQQQLEGNTSTASPVETSNTYADMDLVNVAGPNGIEVMTYAEAKKRGAV